MNKHFIAAAAATLCISSAWAAGNETKPVAPATATPGATSTSNTDLRGARDNKVGNDEKDMLEQKLKAVSSRADYAKVLESNGFRIAAINSDKPDYLEYEVVKGDRSYEVQIDFDKGTDRAKEVDVTANMWRAEATKKMMKDANYKHAGPLVADPDARYSDRRNMKAWTDEKEQLEKALGANQPVASYKAKLQQMGYQITSVNDREADHVEYEIVKGDNSYEVKIDVDAKTKMAKKVDVTSNLWDSQGTERAKDRNQAKN